MQAAERSAGPSCDPLGEYASGVGRSSPSGSDAGSENRGLARSIRKAMRRPSPSLLALRALPFAALLTIAPALSAQQYLFGDRSNGTIAGMVVDAGTGNGLAGALVVIETVEDGAVLRPAGSGMFISRGVTAVTGPDGSYRVSGLAPGPYRLYVRHLAYREATLDLELSQSTFHLSVGLVVNPIRLEPIGVEAPGQAYGRTRT